VSDQQLDGWGAQLTGVDLNIQQIGIPNNNTDTAFDIAVSCCMEVLLGVDTNGLL